MTVIATTAGVVETAFAFVGVPAVTVGVIDPLAWSVVTVPVVATCVPGVPVPPPPAAAVCAAAVCLANSSIIAIGFSTEGKGETNNPVGIKVGVAAGACERDCVQAVTRIVDRINIKIACKLCCLFLMVSPLSTSSEAMVAHDL